MKTLHVAATLLAALLVRGVASAAQTAADETEQMMLAGGAWHAGKRVPCTEGVVTVVGPRLEEPKVDGVQRFTSGVRVEMKLPAAPRFLNGQPFPNAAVVHYQGDSGNTLMASEKPGDRVQVCLAGFPTPSHDVRTGKTICDPNTDDRGFVYRIYDFKRRAAFVGPDSQHSCGGA